MKTPIAALIALAALSLGLVATGCGGDDTATSSGVPRQAGVDAGSPRPMPCPTLNPKEEGILYVSCVDQPVKVWAADVDPYDWHAVGRPDSINGPNNKGPGTEIAPGSFLVGKRACYVWAKTIGWQMGVTLADGSKASARVQISTCLGVKIKKASSWETTWFNKEGGPTSVTLTTNTGKRVKLVAKRNSEVPGISQPLEFRDAWYYPFSPIFIEAA